MSTDFYSREDDDLFDVILDQTVIIKKSHLKYLGVNYKEEHVPVSSPCLEWYPFVNSYYHYTEDVDAYARVNHLLGDFPFPVSESSTSTIRAAGEKEFDPYSEKKAQLQYLESKPVSFWITGKPGVGQEELGKQLAEYWKCVYIDPQMLIEEEIDSNSRAGQCIEFNLRCGRAIGIDVILRLLEKRVRSKSAEHRGFVICGFPMLPNSLYQEDPLSSESAVFTVHDIFEEIIDVTVETGAPVAKNVSKTSKIRIDEDDLGEEEALEDEALEGEAQEDEELLDQPAVVVDAAIKKPQIPIDVGSAYDNICNIPEIGTNYDEQLNFIISLFEKPFIIIYTMCPNADVITKRSNLRFNIYTGDSVNLIREKAEKMMYTVFSREPGATNEDIPDGIFDQDRIGAINLDPSHLVFLPRDFDYNVVSQLNRYHFEAMPLIEKLVLKHDPQYFIKVDGRVNTPRMFSVVKTRLRVMPLQKVLIPERLDAPVEDVGAEDEQPPVFDTEGLTPEDCFGEFRRRGIVSRMFKWNWSDWGSKCPVSMKSGEYVDGDPKYAVQFMNKMYFLKDETAFIKFYRNPRPYLLPPYPRISCRIFVLGPKYSGKTVVSKCLAYLLDGEVISPLESLEEFLKQKEIEFREKVRSGALNEGVLILNEKRRSDWVNRENEKKVQIELWLNKFRTSLQGYVTRATFVGSSESQIPQFSEEMSPFALKMVYLEKEKISHTTLPFVRSEHGEMHLPFIEDVEKCKSLLKDEQQMMQYLPVDMKLEEEYLEKPATVFDAFVQEYAENAVKAAVFEKSDLTLDEEYEIYSTRIKEIEDNNERMGKARSGWIIDGLPPDRNLIEKLSPEFMADHVFVLADDDYHQFLTSRFGMIGTNKFYEFRDVFQRMGNKEAARRCPAGSTDTFKMNLAEEMLNYILQSERFNKEEEEEGDDSLEDGSQNERAIFREKMKMYTYEVIQFYDDWTNLSQYLVQVNIEPFEVNIADKSIEDVLIDVVKMVEDQYRQLASPFDADDRAEEVEDFSEVPPGNDEEGLGEEGEEDIGDDTFMQNRRFGDTFHYCPVTFYEKWVLWKGKEEFAAKFDNKLYFMCNEDALGDFVTNPRKYLPLDAPFNKFPPPRICVSGPTGSGKTHVCKAISQNLGLFYVNFDVILKNEFYPDSDMTLKEIVRDKMSEGNLETLGEYLTNDTPLPGDLLRKLLNRLWFQEPIKSIGFVLDGFPTRPSDIDFMENNKTIPDLILELTTEEFIVHERLLYDYIEAWKIKMVQKQEERERQNQAVLEEWAEKRNARYKSLLEVKRQHRYAMKVADKAEGHKDDRAHLEEIEEVDEDVEVSSFKSMISFDSVADAADVAEVEDVLLVEFPEPVFDDEWETLEEATARINNEIEEAYTLETDFLTAMRENAETQQIPFTQLSANLILKKVIAQAFRLTNKLKFRNESLFERCYEVDVDVAERLLENGYYFLSKFGRTCPVQYCLNENPVQMYLPCEQNFQLFPILHRQFIYFLTGVKNRDLFKENPLKYINVKVNFPLVPLRVAIIGPPKCGKTSLSERFKREFGMKVISRGQAARYVIKYLPFSNLADNMDFVLRNGWELTDEMVIRSVEAFAVDGRCITQGVVFDGFPNSKHEVEHLAQVGLVPQLVINLKATREEVHACLKTYPGKRNLPIFSERFIDHRFDEWAIDEGDFKFWLDKEYQTLTHLSIKPSKWCIWTAANKLSTDVLYEIKHYYRNAFNDWPLRLANMQITPLEFIQRKSDYKQFCPGCLRDFDKLVNGGNPPDRTGLVQYRKFFYWFCRLHLDDFIKCPDQFLTPYNKSLPLDLPTRVWLSEKPANIHEDGVCIVCFIENRPRYVMKEGRLNYAVIYLEKVYLFDSHSCLNKFCEQPLIFFSVTINYRASQTYPCLEYKDLPTLGLLEQFVARQVCKAVTNTGILRPIIPGLSIDVSAAINMGLFLKLHDPSINPDYRPMYLKAHELCVKRRMKLIDALAQMKKQINPYLHYEEPMPKFALPPAPPMSPTTPSTRSTIISMRTIISSITERISYTDEESF